MAIYTWTGRPDRAQQINFSSGTVIQFGGYADLLASEIAYMQNRGDTITAGQIGNATSSPYDPNYDIVTATKLATALAGVSGAGPRRPPIPLRPGHVPMSTLHYRMGITNQISGASFAQGNTRAWFSLGVDASEISFEIPNFYVGSTGEDDTYQVDPVTIRAEVECNGVVEPAQWIYGSGAKQGTVDALGNAGFWCPIRIPAGADAWIRLNYTISTSQKWLAVLAIDDGSGSGANFTASDQSQGTGTLPQQQTTIALGPIYVAGRIANSITQPSMAVIGDSTDEGVGTIEYRGAAMMALRAASPPIGFISMPRAAEALTQFMTRPGTKRRRMLGRASQVWFGHCINDYNVSRTTAQLQADMIAAWSQAAGLGLPGWQKTHTPRSTSTDQWSTLANQTLLSGASTNYLALNIWLRDGAPVLNGAAVAAGSNVGTAARAAVYGTTGQLVTAASGPAHPLGKGGIVDFAAVLESTQGSGLWKPTGRSAVINITNGSATATLVSGIVRPGDYLVNAQIPAGTYATGAADITTAGATINLNGPASGTNTTASVVGAPTGDGTHYSTPSNALCMAAMPIAAIRAAG